MPKGLQPAAERLHRNGLIYSFTPDSFNFLSACHRSALNICTPALFFHYVITLDSIIRDTFTSNFTTIFSFPIHFHTVISDFRRTKISFDVE